MKQVKFVKLVVLTENRTQGPPINKIFLDGTLVEIVIGDLHEVSKVVSQISRHLMHAGLDVTVEVQTV